MTNKRIVIEYPPDYDGELWIETKRKPTTIGEEVTFCFTVSQTQCKSEWDTLVDVANQIIEQHKRM